MVEINKNKFTKYKLYKLKKMLVLKPLMGAGKSSVGKIIHQTI